MIQIIYTKLKIQQKQYRVFSSKINKIFKKKWVPHTFVQLMIFGRIFTF